MRWCPRAESIAVTPQEAGAEPANAPPPEEKIGIAEAHVLSCHDPGPKKTPPPECDRVPELEKAVSLKSDDASLQISLGDAYLNLGQDDKALAAFDLPGIRAEQRIVHEIADGKGFVLRILRFHK